MITRPLLLSLSLSEDLLLLLLIDDLWIRWLSVNRRLVLVFESHSITRHRSRSNGRCCWRRRQDLVIGISGAHIGELSTLFIERLHVIGSFLSYLFHSLQSRFEVEFTQTFHVLKRKEKRVYIGYYNRWYNTPYHTLSIPISSSSSCSICSAKRRKLASRFGFS